MVSNPTTQRFWQRYAVALLLVGCAALLRMTLLQSLGMRNVFLTFYPAVIFAALYGGLGAGLAATVTSALLADYLLIEPAGFGIEKGVDWLGVTIFFASGVLIAAVTEGMHRARLRMAAAEVEAGFAAERERAAQALRESEERLRQSNQELEMRVAERTADLEKTVDLVMQEIAERHSAEAALRKSEERYALAVQGANDGVWDWDLETNEAYLSPRWKSMLGYGEEELGEVVASWKQLIHPADYPRTMALLEDYLAGRLPDYRLEYRLRHKDGSYRWILTRGACYRDDSGKPFRMAGSHTDITARKAAETALQQEIAERLRAMEELREKDRMMIQQSRQAAMGEMINNIAHQWRQPLNTLGLIVQSLAYFREQGEIDRTFLKENTGKAMELIAHMSQTIEDFRNFFKPDKEKAPFSVNQAVKQSISLVEASFGSQYICLDLDVAGDSLVHGYPNEFSQVILNILVNARDVLRERAIPDARVWVRTGRESDRAVVVIADNGGGIPEEIRERLFEPYFTTKGPDQGTGIGLYMAKVIIEKNMGGRLTACNTQDGAEFRIEV